MQNNKAIKICFVGAHGTGKTTLAIKVHKWLTQKKHIPCELIFESSDMNLRTDSRIYEHKLILKREKLFSNFENFISDRSLIDPLGYQLVKSSSVSTKLYNKAVKATRNNNHILLYLPVAIPLVAERTRPTDKKYQHAVSKAILSILIRSQLKFYYISSPDLFRRLDFVRSIIKRDFNLFKDS